MGVDGGGFENLFDDKGPGSLTGGGVAGNG